MQGFLGIIVSIVPKHLVVIHTSIFDTHYALFVFIIFILRFNRMCSMLVKK